MADKKRALRGSGFRLRYGDPEIAVSPCTVKAFLKKRFHTSPIPAAGFFAGRKIISFHQNLIFSKSMKNPYKQGYDQTT